MSTDTLLQAPPIQYSNPERLHTFEETATILHERVTKGQIKEMVERGDLYTVQIGNTKFIPHRAITCWLERVHEEAQSEPSMNVLANGTDVGIAGLLRRDAA